MKNLTIFTSIAAALALSSGLAMANMETLEKCVVVDKNGNNLVKAGKNDCATSSHSCAGQSTAGDPTAFITVPQGQCVKINAGDYAGISNDIKAKITGAM